MDASQRVVVAARAYLSSGALSMSVQLVGSWNKLYLPFPSTLSSCCWIIVLWDWKYLAKVSGMAVG